MKSFFYIVFGGLATLGIGVGFAHGVSMAWPVVTQAASSVKVPNLAATFSKYANFSISLPISLSPGITASTTISGLKRMIRYTASEEEDLISAATLSLPDASPVNVTAGAYIVKSINSGIVSLEHNSNTVMPIASLSKLVTAIVARQKVSPSARITMNQRIMATYGNTAQFKVGETFVASDLYYPLLMVSSNDAAEAFAQFYGRAKFIQAMNDFVQSIGAYRTSFEDPSGLSPRNVSTANDLVIIMKWIEKNDPGIMDITKMKTKTVRSHTWVNPTHFLNWSNYAGGKNGYTPEADRTGAALFSMDHDTDKYAVIVLGSAARDADVVKLLSKVK
ncbi:MAG: serine hydrolase [Candidatus Taylorbacteria bacterium]